MSNIELRLRQMRTASRELRQASSAQRNKVLKALTQLMQKNAAQILAANQRDLNHLDPAMNSAFRDRLTLDPQRLQQMISSLKKVQALPDPLGEVTERRRLKNGLQLRKVRAPLGVILMIFEARPNVVTEAFSLALKSGNCLILRGGKESLQTCIVLYSLINQALSQAKLDEHVFWGVEDAKRELTQQLMVQDQWIDVLVPRGGDSLINYVTQNATIPIIKNDRGLCHVYVHKDADAKMAINIVENAKVQRPGVCNSMETLLIHSAKKNLLPLIYDRLSAAKVQWYGCPETLKILDGRPGVFEADEASYKTEYLDYKINCRVVDALNTALAHIEENGSRHSESIVTKSKATARTFQESVDAAAVYWNASTRFTDGFEFGLGGELGISTQKLHVRGPVGLRELTSLRWIIDGRGQTR